MIPEKAPPQQPIRQKLLIMKVDAPQEVGAKKIPKLSFAASDGDKELSYFTFKRDLFPVIQGAIGKTLEADVVVSSREYQGNTYVDRRVAQIYQDGQPVAARALASQEGGRWQDSPEKRTSIEVQTALKEAVQLIIAGKAPLEMLEALSGRCYRAMRSLVTGEAPITVGQAMPVLPPSGPPVAASIEPRTTPLPAEAGAGQPGASPTKPVPVPASSEQGAARQLPQFKSETDRRELLGWVARTWGATTPGRQPSHVWKTMGLSKAIECGLDNTQVAQTLIATWGWPEAHD